MSISRVYNLRAGGTEVASTVQRLQNQRENTQFFSFAESLSLLADSLKEQISETEKNVRTWELVPTGTATWNAYQLYRTCVELEKGLRELDRINSGNFGPVLFLDNQDLRTQVVQRHRRAVETLIKRCKLSASAAGIRVLKVSTILISSPLIRKGIEGTLDAAAHGLILEQYITTENPALIQFPENVTWKDRTFRAFKITAIALAFLNSLLIVASTFDYVDQKDTSYKMVSRTSAVLTFGNFFYEFLKIRGFVASRE